MSLLYPALRYIGHQHWIPRGRERFIRLFADPDRLIDHPFSVDFFGATYNGNLNNLVDWHVYFYGAYSYQELFLLRDVCDGLNKSGRAPTFYDVGANVGHHALFMSPHVDSVFAFEPYDVVRGRLEDRLSENRCENVTVFSCALGAENGDTTFYLPDGANQGGGSISKSANRSDSVRRRTTVQLRRGDDIRREQHLPLPSLLKIDVEGAERDVLEGLRDTVREAEPIVVLELLEDSRQHLESEDTLRGLLYDNAELFAIETEPGEMNYRLTSFDFSESTVILAAPSGLLQSIERVRARLKE